MAINFLNSIDLNQNQLQNAVIQNVGSTPSGGTYVLGQAAYNTSSKDLIIYDGSTWEQVGGSFTLRADGPSGANTFVVSPGSTVDLTGGTNMSVARGSGANSNVFTINTTATPDQTIELTGAVTGSGTGTFTTTLQAVVDATKFVASALTKSAEDFVENATDTQIPTTKSVYNYVNLALTGTLVFKGGFNANTGIVTSGPNAPDNLYGDVAITAGDYYIVTVPGNFFSDSNLPLTVGDQVIADNTVASGSVAKTDFTIVQADRDLATLTTVGIGNVNASATSGIDVSYSSGTASLVIDVDEVTASTDTPKKILGTDQNDNTKTFTEAEFFQHRFLKLVLTDTDITGGISRQYDSGTGITDFEIDFSNFMGGVSAEDLSVEIVRNSGDRDTVYAELKRVGDIMNVYFSGAEVTNSAMLLMLTNVD